MLEENLRLDLHFSALLSESLLPRVEWCELGLRKMLQGVYLFIAFELSFFISSSPSTELGNTKNQKYSVPCPHCLS